MSEFPEFDFDRLNEADIREEVLAPLLRILGYRSGTRADIIREQPLRYPRISMGRRKNRDPHLRGRADYICDVDGLVRWTIEAKAPSAGIDDEAREQAFTYANHPEVRAVYYVLSDGRSIEVYQTNLGPQAPPALLQAYSEIQRSTAQLASLLAPDSLLEAFPRQQPDTGPPLGSGLRSVVRIASGTIDFDPAAFGSPDGPSMIFTMTGGAIERKPDGGLSALMETLSPFREYQNVNELLGLHKTEFESPDNVLSEESEHPTVFSSERSITLPRGVTVWNIPTGGRLQLPRTVTATAITEARGTLNGRRFAGSFSARYRNSNLREMEMLDVRGTFAAHLA